MVNWQTVKKYGIRTGIAAAALLFFYGGTQARGCANDRTITAKTAEISQLTIDKKSLEHELATFRIRYEPYDKCDFFVHSMRPYANYCAIVPKDNRGRSTERFYRQEFDRYGNAHGPLKELKETSIQPDPTLSAAAP